MQKSYVWSRIGKLLIIIGCSMFIPAAVGMYYHEDAYLAFLLTAAMVSAAGGVLYFGLRPTRWQKHISLRENYALVAYGWLVVTLAAMIPYLWTGTFHTVTDAFFETMSGLTTVGASVLDDIEGTARCVLMWRSLTHWLGGMGIMVLFVALLAGHGVDAMQIFRAESSGPVKGKLRPQISETARSLWCIYMANTVIVIVLYLLAGLNLFDALNHGFSVISTGGFSTKNASLGYYDSAVVDWVTVIAMFLAGVNYSLYFYAWRNKNLKCFLQSLEFRVYVCVALFFTLAVVWFIAPDYGYHWLVAFRYAAFQVVSILSTTGFITCDFEQWAMPAQMLLMLLMLCGACAGSTTGGIKIDRHVILAKKAVQEIRRFLHPRMVTRLKSNNQLLDDDVVLSVMTFFYIYLVLVLIATYLVCLCGGEFLDSLTAVMSCLGGVGPAWGQWGPTESFSSAPMLAKWILSFLMLIGRLELYTVLVLFLPLPTKRQYQDETDVVETLEEDAFFEPMVREE